MALYSIKLETLTDIGDALRRKYGETEIVTITAPTVISKSHAGATGFDSYASSVSQLISANRYEVINIPNSTTIYIKIGTETQASDTYIQIASGSLDTMPEDAITLSGEHKINYYYFENTDTITIHFYKPSSSNAHGLGYYAEIVGCDANGNPVGDSEVKEAEIEIKRKYKSSEIAGAIEPLDFIPESALVISGDCSYRFSNNGWNWFIEKYSNKITTKDIRNALYMFNSSKKITKVPFDLNFDSSSSYHDLDSIFSYCDNITQLPKLNNVKVYQTRNMFYNCNNLRTIPENIADTWDWSYLEGQTSEYTGMLNEMFSNCYSLRSIPMNLIKSGNPCVYYGYSYYPSGFFYCYALDELINLPVPYTKAKWTYNAFGSTFSYCHRLKNVTFALNNGVPYTVAWKSQVIDLSNYVGYALYNSNIIKYNSGITADKEVKDDATYQALKNDPDWWTGYINYSRYNHDSAVATINSLPDTSAYLATAGGTNTIKFRGQSGASTDGGAINTLTEEEIAVAAAKGWTVTLV